MQNYKKSLFIGILLVISGCATSTTSLSSNSNYGHNNYKYFPYKSAIIKYERGSKDSNHKRVRIWDNWGIQWWEESEDIYKKTSRNPNPMSNRNIIFKDNGTYYEVSYFDKTIKKQRDIMQDKLLVANEDLSDYYVDSYFAEAVFYNPLRRNGKTEIVAGKKCNIWESRETRLCMYKDLILLKLETRGEKKWVIQQKAVSAQFNVAIDKSLFTLPNFPIKVHPHYIGDNEMHTHMRKHSRGKSQLVQMIKFKGKRIRDQIKNNGYVRD